MALTSLFTSTPGYEGRRGGGGGGEKRWSSGNLGKEKEVLHLLSISNWMVGGGGEGGEKEKKTGRKKGKKKQ